MQPSAQASSISSSQPRRSTFLQTVRSEFAAVAASWRAAAGERIYHLGLGGGLAQMMLIPIVQIAIFAIVYGNSPDLLSYLVVATAAGSFIMAAIFYNGEILDREREKGTLVSLFLAPCSRAAWLTGFTLVGVIQTMVMLVPSLIFGWLAFGVTYDPNVAALSIASLLFIVALWGMGLIFSGIGLLLKRANAFSNLVWPLVAVFGGLYFPVSELPDGLRHIARALPFGYGLQAIADASLRDASISDLSGELYPLAAFAIFLPVAGIITFRWIERLVRVRGELDLY
jgi:ABC-2 type transport system permease protein